ncbi:hypothetical protein CRE_01179 [Caenorhabditis remanei]|uniref:F-box domain-containing protein n=1 Tax=Caenorhabditis remanei TaxID=31234 RepID=E3MWF4_CAERE|nr:hypothetical protein CRE_01179 [Caenorhabditis remanei]
MPLKILSFPYLVQEKIVKSMEYVDIFMMSLCSKRAKNCAIRTNLQIPKLWFIVSKKGSRVGIQVDERIVRTLIKLQDCLRNGLVEPFVVKMGNNHEITATIKSEEQRSGRAYCLMNHLGDSGRILKAIQEQIQVIFRSTEPYSLKLHVSELNENLPVFENIKDILVSGKKLESDVLERLLGTYPGLNSLDVNPLINGNVLETSHIFQIDRICFSDCGSYGLEVLRRFTGSHIVLIDAPIRENDVVDIIRKWIANEAYQNIETLMIYLKTHVEINPQLVMDSFPTERYNPAVRPPIFHYDSKIIDRYPDEMDFSEDDFCRDVIRGIDGKRASIGCLTEAIFFVVWN